VPVSYLPCFTWILLITVPLLFLARGRKPFRIAVAVSGSIVLFLLLLVYVPAWILMLQVNGGDPAVKYDLARWKESHCEQLQGIILWPCEPDVLGGFAWLERAAEQDYPPAVWLVGVRLKYGIHVPRPQNWTGPAGNTFAQPERGQKMIDRAIRLGFQPPGDEETYYMRVYRR
jgi:hypothetical protein